VLSEAQIVLSYTQSKLTHGSDPSVIARPLRRTALEEALQTSKHRLRRWLETLEPLCSREMRERSAAHYSRTDLGFLFMVMMLADAGLDMAQLKSISRQLHKLIAGPVTAGIKQVVVLHYDNGWHVDGEPGEGCLTLRLPLWVAREAADRYWSGDPAMRKIS
jgi:MerR HTH family regulatory protein